MKTILVTGASGSLGRVIVSTLQSKGLSVRAAVRTLGKVTFPAGVTAVPFDFTNAASIPAALKGIDGLVLISPPLDTDAHKKAIPVVDAAKSAGVRHIIMISAMGVDQAEGSPLRLLERHIIGSGVPYTILRPNFFMENFSTGFLAGMLKQGGIFLAAAAAKTSFISAVDIAEVAAAAFQKDLTGTEYTLTGPAALDHTQVAAIISKAAGKTITYTAIPEPDMLNGMRSAGLPEGAVQYAGTLYSAVRAGYTAPVSTEVANITGRNPVTFESFAAKNANSWR